MRGRGKRGKSGVMWALELIASLLRSQPPKKGAKMTTTKKVQMKDVQATLQFLISMEEAGEWVQEKRKNEIEKGEALLRAFGEQIRPQTLEIMQQVYYSIINGESFQENVFHRATAIAYLNEAWNGVGPWRM